MLNVNPLNLAGRPADRVEINSEFDLSLKESPVCVSKGGNFQYSMGILYYVLCRSSRVGVYGVVLVVNTG